MKKTLIAAAALAVATGAMAELKISGTYDPTFSQVTQTPASGSGIETVSSDYRTMDGLGTTGVKFAVTEDLGDGLKALGMFEHNFGSGSTGAAGGSATGEWFAGLGGGFGTIKMGAPNTVSLSVQGLSSGSFGTKPGGRTSIIPGANFYGTSLTRFYDSVQYASPNLGGATVSATYVPGKTVDGDVTVGSIMDIGVVYAAGPLSVGVSSYSVAEVDTPAKDPISQLTVGVKYNLGVAVLGVGYTQYTPNEDDEQTSMRLAVDFPLSEMLTLTGTYQTLTYDDDGEEYAGNQFAVGAQYKLAKSTTVYGRYLSGAMETAADDAEGSGFLAGIMVTF